MPAAGSLRTSMLPPKASTCSLTASSPTPRPAMPLTSLGGREARLREHLGERAGPARLGQRRLGDAAAVVGDRDLDRAAALLGAQLQPPALRLAGPRALLGRLDAVGDGVAQDVDERLGEPFEDGAVELRLGAEDDQLDLLAGLGGEVAHGARERRHDRRQRQRAHPDRRVLEVARAGARRRRARRRAARGRCSRRARARAGGDGGRSRPRGRAACRSSRPARGSSGSRSTPAATADRLVGRDRPRRCRLPARRSARRSARCSARRRRRRSRAARPRPAGAARRAPAPACRAGAHRRAALPWRARGR